MLITLLDVQNIQPKTFRLHRENGRSDYLFVLFRSPAMVLVEGSYVQALPGQCILFGKYKIQSYHPLPGMEFCHDFIHFDIQTQYEDILLSSIPKGVLITLPLPEQISSSLEQILTEQRSSSTYRNDILSHLGTIFLYRIKNALQQGPIHPKKQAAYQALRALRDEIYRQPQQDWCIDRLCRHACLSRSYLQHLYREFFGVSCMEDVILARLCLAKQLLLTGDLPVQEVSRACGYQNVTHFIRQFRQRTGMPPERFRFQ